MTTPLIAELERLVGLSEAATPGEWRIDQSHIFTVPVYGGREHREVLPLHDHEYGDPLLTLNDAFLIVDAVNFIRQHKAELLGLVERVRELEADNARLCKRHEIDKAYITKMDGIIEEVGGVTASCINPYEDLKRALQGQKQRAEAAEQRAARLETDAALGREVDGWVCMNTPFTGEPPYVGNAGIMLALQELKQRAERAESRLNYLLDTPMFSADVYHTLGSDKAAPELRLAAIDTALAARGEVGNG